MKAAVQGLMGAFAGESMAALAAQRENAKSLLGMMKAFPPLAGQAEWLENHLDFLEVASVLNGLEMAEKAKPATGKVTVGPGTAAAKGKERALATKMFQTKVASKPVPKGAAAWKDVAKKAFREEGVPEALVWQAEVESAWNPSARSPAGAVGLYQFMKGTARENGLKTEPEDERLDGEKSARAAARYLKKLHGRFGDWALALAGYNCGPARVAKLLKECGATDFDGISAKLPTETRLYVPKIDAVMQAREGVGLADLK
jgi:membrane-bound lytic murein transglycosylase D